MARIRAKRFLRRGKAVAGAFRNPGTAAARIDVMQVVEQVVVAADLEL